jgi:hypothetical protein
VEGGAAKSNCGSLDSAAGATSLEMTAQKDAVDGVGRFGASARKIGICLQSCQGTTFSRAVKSRGEMGL